MSSDGVFKVGKIGKVGRVYLEWEVDNSATRRAVTEFLKVGKVGKVGRAYLERVDSTGATCEQ